MVPIWKSHAAILPVTQSILKVCITLAHQARRQAKRPSADGRVNGRAPFAPKPRQDHAHRPHKAMPHRAPVPLVRESTPGDQTMQRRLPHPRLTSGMERGDEARTGPQRRRGAEEFNARLGHRGKQPVGLRSPMHPRPLSALIGQGKKDVIMLTGQ
jgi:hypothetical protein